MNKFVVSSIVAFASIPLFGACAVEVEDSEPGPADVAYVDEAAGNEEEDLGTTSQGYGCGHDVERWCNGEARMYASTSGGCIRFVRECPSICRNASGPTCFDYAGEIVCGWGTWAYCLG